MKTLITPAQVVKLAFADGEYLPPEIVAEADIAAAEQRWIVPMLGAPLHEKLLGGLYPEFVAEYLAATIALFTRVAIQPRLDIRTDRCGTTAPKSSSTQPADARALRLLRQQLLAQARTLLRRAAAYLVSHNGILSEYDSEQDILNRCTICGGLVLTHPPRSKGGIR